MVDISQNTRVVLSFTDIFKEDEREDISNLLKEIPSKQALQVVAHFSALFHNNEDNLRIQGEALKQWLGRLEIGIRKKFLIAALPFMKKGNFLFITQPSCLYLLQEILSNYNHLEEREFTPLDEYNLFKAYMISSEWSIKISSEIQERGVKSVSDFVDISLRTQLPISDFKLSREFYIQAYKAISFFEFAENREGFKDIIDDFISSTNLTNWREYLKSILHIYVSYLLKFNEPNKSILNFDKQNHVTEFLDYLTVDFKNFDSKRDFISIREKPVFKLSEGSYLFLNLDLFIDKIFNGILFDIFSAISGNDYKEINTADFATFKSVIGESFTEEVLFYDIMEYIKDKDWLSYSGKELKEKINGAPDFYIRRRNKVFVFECKDTIIRFDTKSSYNFETIKEEIKRKLITGTSQKKKGLAQILSVISKLDEGLMSEFDDFDSKLAKFYPIIIVTDRVLDEYGVNYLFNSSFEDVKAEFNLENYKINKPILIQMDDLIKFADLFKDKKLKLNSIFDSYVAQGNSENYLSQTKSFSDFLKKKAFKFSNKKGSFVDNKLKVIFELDEMKTL